jgi:hypothetical protein
MAKNFACYNILIIFVCVCVCVCVISLSDAIKIAYFIYDTGILLYCSIRIQCFRKEITLEISKLL